jgi:hypothetical protein
LATLSQPCLLFLLPSRLLYCIVKSSNIKKCVDAAALRHDKLALHKLVKICGYRTHLSALLEQTRARRKTLYPAPLPTTPTSSASVTATQQPVSGKAAQAAAAADEAPTL